MVTVAIIGIVAAIGLSDFSVFSRRTGLVRQADEMGAQLCRIRDRAMRDSVPWRMLFTPESRSWTCYGDANRNGRPDASEQFLGPFALGKDIEFGSRSRTGPGSTVVPQDGISFVDNRVCYSPMGACNAGTVYLMFHDRSMALRVLPASGTVVIYEYAGSWERLR